MEDSTFEGGQPRRGVMDYPNGRRLAAHRSEHYAAIVWSLPKATEDTIKFAARTWKRDGPRTSSARDARGQIGLPGLSTSSSTGTCCSVTTRRRLTCSSSRTTGSGSCVELTAKRASPSCTARHRRRGHEVAQRPGGRCRMGPDWREHARAAGARGAGRRQPGQATQPDTAPPPPAHSLTGVQHLPRQATCTGHDR